MEWKLQNIFGANEEISSLAEYFNFRILRLPHMTSETMQDDLLNKNALWTSTSDTDYVKQFSAVCLLTAKYMADELGKDKVHISKWLAHYIPCRAVISNTARPAIKSFPDFYNLTS